MIKDYKEFDLQRLDEALRSLSDVMDIMDDSGYKEKERIKRVLLKAEQLIYDAEYLIEKEEEA